MFQQREILGTLPRNIRFTTVMEQLGHPSNTCLHYLRRLHSRCYMSTCSMPALC
jgi:hypothetical protein